MKRLAIAVTAIAMVATPLADIGSSLRVTLAHLVVGGLFVITLLSARSVWGQRAFVASAVIVGIGFGVEIVGSRTGFPFGSYDYTSLLAPQIANVPVVVAFAWCAMALPAREVAGAICGERAPGAARVIVGAVALTAWDVFLDPHMVMEGYWVWPEGGSFFGIPLSNYLGWLGVSALLMVVLEVALPPRGTQRTPVVQYVAVAAMETIGFVFFFGDPAVGLWGALTMGMLGVLALMRSTRAN
jgi:putative membrane protein